MVCRPRSNAARHSARPDSRTPQRRLCEDGAVSEHPTTKPRISTRIGAIAESATLAVDAKAKALKAAGRPVIGFGAGEPDFPTPDYIVEAAVAACSVPANHRYTPAGGPARPAPGGRGQDPARLRLPGRAVPGAGDQRRQAGRVRGLRRPWSTRATRCCCPRRTGPPTPRRSGWPAASPSRCSPAPTRATWSPSTSSRRPGTERTKALLFCSPSNPTGAVYSPEQTEAIGRWALEHGIWVITDEIYEHLTYDDAVFTPMVARGARARRTPPSCSTASPRPTR